MTALPSFPPSDAPSGAPADAAARCLAAIERKVLWLSTWMIHHANHLRPSRDGLKVGGHQASCASMVTLMTALYFDVLRPADRVAVKPHGSPVFHAIQYLLGNQTRDQLERFRAFGGAQSYPSRTKDRDDVDISTGSVGMGVAMTSFLALAQQFLRTRGLAPDDAAPGRMIAIAGDAEFDEGNVFEALLEAWKHHVTDVWWIIDYNRQSLDAIVADRFFHRLDTVFETMEWRVVTLKYGHRLEAAFTRRGGGALRQWIDDCPNSTYSALAYQGGAAWRSRLVRDLGDTAGIRELLDEHDDDTLHQLMTNLAGHDLDTVREAFHRAARDDVPTCFIAYTIKGHGLPFEGHKDNHSGLTSPQQIAALRDEMGIAEGEEWDPLAGLEVPPQALRAFLDAVPFNQAATRRHDAPRISVPAEIEVPPGDPLSTQAGFGRVLADVARRHPDLADRIVTTSPDVTVSTNLGGWVNRRGVFARSAQADAFRATALSAQDWTMGPGGQHLELGIAENNLFVLLAALGLTGPLFGTRLLPVGTLYDPFISRGLDALNYACYQDARFISSHPVGGQPRPRGGRPPVGGDAPHRHGAAGPDLVRAGLRGRAGRDPAWSFEHVQAEDGGAVYLRLSTRPPRAAAARAHARRAGRHRRGRLLADTSRAGGRPRDRGLGAGDRRGGRGPPADRRDVPGAGVLVVTSADRLQQGWMRAVTAGGPSAPGSGACSSRWPRRRGS